MLSWPSLSNQSEHWLCSSGFGSKNLAERRLLPQRLVKSWCVRIQGKFNLILCPAACGTGHTVMEALLGQQFPPPLTPSFPGLPSPLDYKESQVPPPQPGARLPGAVLQEGRCMFVTPLEDWQQFHTNWLKVFMKLLWEDPKGLECCVGTAPLYCQGKETLCEDMHGWGKSP